MRQIQISGLTINVVKKNIKNMHLTVRPPHGQIHISAPLHFNDEVIESFVISKRSWIKKHQKIICKQVIVTPREYITGERLYLAGKPYQLQICEWHGKHKIELGKNNSVELYVRPSITKQGKEKILDDWYRNHLKTTVPLLLDKWEQITKVKCAVWNVKKMRTKWGSCAILQRKILLNLELAKVPQHCLEYVIVHELTHLYERYHNDNFRAYLDQFMPDWKIIQKELNNFSFHV